MPPRKSTASNPPDEGGAETTPVSKGKKDDSVGVEVCQSHRKPLLMVTDESFPGSQPPQINDRSPRERGVASKHTDTEGCLARITQECNRFCELHCFEVRLILRTERDDGGCHRHYLHWTLSPDAKPYANSKPSSNDLAHIGGKKTISPQDVMSALKDAELEGFLPRLEAELKSEQFALIPPSPDASLTSL